jgi:dihydrofolate reductase
MSRLISSTAMTVDGLIDVGEWYVLGGQHSDESFDLLQDAAAMLMGRKTYEGLAAYWSPLEDEWARMLNPMPKYVASRTLEGPLEWNATLIEGDAVEGVRKLKDELDGDLFLTGSGELARNLIAGGVVDELWFQVHPAVWGEGTRPFEGERTRLKLLESRSYDSGVTVLRYEPLAAA